MTDKFLQCLRSYLLSVTCIDEAFTGIHLLETTKSKMPFLLVKQNASTSNSIGQTNRPLSKLMN